jgi:hypothetical protein
MKRRVKAHNIWQQYVSWCKANGYGQRVRNRDGVFDWAFVDAEANRIAVCTNVRDDLPVIRETAFRAESDESHV